MTTDTYPAAFLKRPHMKRCDGALVRCIPLERAHVDRTGRVGNGGIVVWRYECNRSWAGCEALVLVTERAVRLIAVSVEVRK